MHQDDGARFPQPLHREQIVHLPGKLTSRRAGIFLDRAKRFLAQRRLAHRLRMAAPGQAEGEGCGKGEGGDKGLGPHEHAASLARRFPAWQRLNPA
jgi:hypothetical protein